MKKCVVFMSLLVLMACSNEKTQNCVAEIDRTVYVDRICVLPVGENGVDVDLVGADGKNFVKHFSKQEAETVGIYDCEEPAKYGVFVSGVGLISQDDAVDICLDWIYSDFKSRNEAEMVIKKYRSDACEVLERLKKYIESKKSE